MNEEKKKLDGMESPRPKRHAHHATTTRRRAQVKLEPRDVLCNS